MAFFERKTFSISRVVVLFVIFSAAAAYVSQRVDHQLELPVVMTIYF
ncbi:MAG: hypothetical protein AAGH89_01250 [Verrucomicrobiota bacterium]